MTAAASRVVEKDGAVRGAAVIDALTTIYTRTVGITGGWGGEFDPPVHCANPFFPFCWRVNRNPQFSFLQFLDTVVVHCSCLAFRTDSAMFVFRTLVKFTSSILSLSRVSQCIMINYN